MTHRVLALGFGLLFLLVQIGCNDNVVPPPTAGPGGGGGGNALCSDEGGPVVSILQPAPASDPNVDELLTTEDVQIQCQVASSGDPVDDSSVVIRVFGEDSDTDTPSVANRGNGLFEATASVAAFANGTLQVTCEASNAGPSGPCTGAAVDTFLDLGPGVEILNPSTSGAVRSGGMTVQFRLTQLPVSESDTDLSAPTSWQVVVAGRAIDSVLESQTATSGTFSATVDFDDPSLYQTPLDGMYQLSVSATNGRGVTRTETLDFTVDAEGPSIEIEEPELGAVIGGATDVVATVSDASGIDPSQVSFYIGADKFDMDLVPGSTDRFRGSFDANQYPTSIGEVLIDVVAVDIVGNEHVASVVVELDGIPPIMELDPENVREGKDGADGLECSALFDPLGDRAISDSELVFPISYIRARIEDRGNPTASYKSGLDFGSPQVWIRRGFDLPLVIDTDGDDVCDSLNPDVLPGNQMGNIAAVAIDLVSVPPTGTADFLENESFGSPLPFEYTSCLPGGQTEPNDNVCNNVTIPRVIPDNTDPAGAADGIFAKAPITEIYCMGDPFDWQTSLNGVEGPGCMAVRASDERGNTSVSPPLRVCFTLAGGGCGNFNFDDDTCTDGCSGARFRSNERIGPFL